jgi:hypothetical protein
MIDFINNLSINESKIFVGKEGVLKTTGPLMYTKIIEKNFHNGIKFFDSRDFLDYGSSFYGIPIYNYIHYSLLNEPIFLNGFSSIPNIIHSDQDHYFPGINLNYSFIILNDLKNLIDRCNVVFCKKNNDLFFLSFDSLEILEEVLYFIRNIEANEEKIHLYNDLYIKQTRIDENNEIVFHFKKFTKKSDLYAILKHKI